MARSKLKLIGRYVAWGDNIRDGRLTRSDGTGTRVLVQVLPELDATPSTLSRLREDATVLARARHPNLLRVEHITAVGHHAALVLEFFEGASMARTLAFLARSGRVVPTRAALEIVAAVATALDAVASHIPPDPAGGRLYHPGPTPRDVLVDPLGRVKLAGLKHWRPNDRPPQRPAGYAPPEAEFPPGLTAYGLGALLVELLTGEAPPPGSTAKDRHEATLRRVLIRVLSRPSDGLGKKLGDAIRAAMARDPTQRPSPAGLARRLRALAAEARSPALKAWAPATIPAVFRWRTAPAASTGPSPAASLQPPPSPEGLSFEDRPTTVIPQGAPRPGFSESTEEATEMMTPELMERLLRSSSQKATKAGAQGRASSSPAGRPAEPPPNAPAQGQRPARAPREERPAQAPREERPAPGTAASSPPQPSSQPASPPSAQAEPPRTQPATPALAREAPPQPPTAPAREQAPSPREAPKPAEDEARPGKPPPPPPPPAPPAGPSPKAAASLSPAEERGPEEEEDDFLQPRRARWPWIVGGLAALFLAWFAVTGGPGSGNGPAESPAEQPAGKEEPAEVSTSAAPAEEPEKGESPAPEEGAGSSRTAPAEESPAAETATARAIAPARPSSHASSAARASSPSPKGHEAGSGQEEHRASASSTRSSGASRSTRQPASPPSPGGSREATSQAASPEASSLASPTGSASSTASTASTASTSSKGTSAATSSASGTAPSSAAPSAPPPGPVGPFTVVFGTHSAGVQEIEVKCNDGSRLKGPPPLTLSSAQPGPCRVTAYYADGSRKVAFAALRGPASLDCDFEGASRLCQ